MRFFTFILGFLFMMSCQEKSASVYRKNFLDSEKNIIRIADSIIRSAYFSTLITLDKQEQPRARIVEPFLPEKEFVIWIGTNPKSRKVKQLMQNSKATLHYFDKSKLAYVSLMGNAFLVNKDSIKSVKFKKGWDKFYPNRKNDYLLIKFIPETLEVINLSSGYSGDSITWKPHRVVLRNYPFILYKQKRIF